jgi:hypothetical protein
MAKKGTRVSKRARVRQFPKTLASQHGLVINASYEILVTDENFARGTAAKYGAQLKRTKDGWLVRKPMSKDWQHDRLIAMMRVLLLNDRELELLGES